MNRNLMSKLAAAGLVALLAVALGGSAAAAGRRAAAGASGGSYYYDFEQTLRPWQAGPGAGLALQRGDSACPATAGAPGGAAVVSMAPSAACCPGGTSVSPPAAWMLAGYNNPGANLVSVSWAAKMQGGCTPNCASAVFIGNAKPTQSSQFVGGFAATATPGWNQYQYRTEVDTPGPIYVGLGWIAAGPTLSIPQAKFDCVTIGIWPIVQGSALQP